MSAPPAGKCGTFHGVLFTLCKLLHGHVEMSKDNVCIQATANNPTWILTTPGTRWQIKKEVLRLGFRQLGQMGEAHRLYYRLLRSLRPSRRSD